MLPVLKQTAEQLCFPQLTLDLIDGCREEASRMLEIGERTLYRKIKEYELRKWSPVDPAGAIRVRNRFRKDGSAPDIWCIL